jgi:hypothetical protein
VVAPSTPITARAPGATSTASKGPLAAVAQAHAPRSVVDADRGVHHELGVGILRELRQRHPIGI